MIKLFLNYVKFFWNQWSSFNACSVTTDVLLCIIFIYHIYNMPFIQFSVWYLVFQLFIGAPFIYANADGYINQRAFFFKRQFDQNGSENWRFIPEVVFNHYMFQIALMFCQLAFWVYFATQIWFRWL